jgi:hypothetical protein
MKGEKINEGFYFGAFYYAMLQSDPEIKSHHVAIYAIVCGFTFTGGQCKAGDKYFAKMLNLSPRMAQKSIATLVAKGFLKKRLNGRMRILFPVPLQSSSLMIKPDFDSIECH